MELFDNLDRVQYRGQTLTNILRRVKPIRRIIEKVNVFYDYTIKEGERADTIAHDYYGSSSYTWLVYVSNNIYDPYYQWPLNNTQFFDYMQNKYGDFFQTQIDLKGYTHPDYQYIVSELTFNQWSQEKQAGWKPISIYDWEYQLNEDKRNIRLVSNQYISVIDKQISELFN